MKSNTRDTALRAVGRNVVNFQRLEGCVKSLARLQSIEGTLPKIRERFEARSQRLSRSTLGSAILGWLNVLDHTETTIDPPEDFFDVFARFAFSIELSDEEKDQHSNALSALLAERNQLIHEGLLSIDWGSPSQCRKLAADLDAQNERIVKELDFLIPILRALSEAANKLDQVIKADARTEIQAKCSEEPMPSWFQEPDK